MPQTLTPQVSAPTDSERMDQHLSELARTAVSLGAEIVDIAEFLDEVDAQSAVQTASLQDVQQGASRVFDANSSVQDAVATVVANTEATMSQVENSVSHVRCAGQRSLDVARWVTDLTERMSAVSKTISAIEADMADIARISAQVNILAINAKIEAARAGASGRGFAVVAAAISDLSKQTDSAAGSITGNIASLTKWIKTVQTESATVGSEADGVIQDSEQSDAALTEIAGRVRSTLVEARRISGEAAQVGEVTAAFAPAFARIGTGNAQIASGIGDVRQRVHSLVDRSESMVQSSVACGASTQDSRFIDRVCADAAKIGAIFSKALQSGRISPIALFSHEYRPIPDTSPEQLLAPFTGFTDQVLPHIQEAALDFDPSVVFCAAVNTDGYLPTHNLKFSHPQGSDPDWNMSNCRNRRMFNDRVGLKAGRNTEPFLLQIYRRAMGNGEFVLMKDLSAPIMVDGRHWGGLRLAYRF